MVNCKHFIEIGQIFSEISCYQLSFVAMMHFRLFAQNYYNHKFSDKGEYT